MTITPRFSKQELMTDVSNVLAALARELGRIYGSANTEHLMGAISLPCSADRAMESQEQNRIMQLPIASYMSYLYDYAMLGVLDADLLWDWEVAEEDVIGFFDGLRHFPLLSNNADDYSLATALEVVELAQLRRMLDIDKTNEGTAYSVLDDGSFLWGHIALKDLARLAGIDEKSIRNMATPKAKNPLKTVKHGNRTFVEIEVARHWLNQRGFQETKIRHHVSRRDISTTGFVSSNDLGAYITELREHAGLSTSDLALKMSTADAAGKIIQTENGHISFSVEFLSDLAKALSIDARTFVLAVLQLHHRNEMARIERELEEMPDSMS